MNSPEIDHYGFHELSTVGESNAEGFALASYKGRAQIYKNGSAYELSITHGRLQGRQGLSTITGQALVGAELRVEHQGEHRYTIFISRVRDVPYFVGQGTLEVYKLIWAPVSATTSAARVPHNVCSSPATADDRDKPGLMGMQADESVLFEGDRIDARAKRVSSERDDSWFNIGCAGHTLAKWHLTQHSAIAPQAPAWPARQATLKLLSADYCGTGQSFTVAGEPVLWMGGLMTYWTTPDHLEARWSEAGATCLHQPRLAETTLPAAGQLFPDIWAAIRAVCTPPPCNSEKVNDLDGAERVSANARLY